MKSTTKICLATLLIAAVPLGLLWKESASLRARVAAQSLAVPPPAAGDPAKPAGRGSVLVPRTDKQAAQQGVSGAINGLQVLEDPDSVRRAERFHTLVGSMTPESARDAAESLEDMRNRNGASGLNTRGGAPAGGRDLFLCARSGFPS